MRHAILAASLALATACATARPIETGQPAEALPPAPRVRTVGAPTPEDEARAVRARDEAARHLTQQAERLWRLWVGLEPPAEAEPADHLFEPETVRAVERVAAHAEAPRTWRRLYAFLAAEFFDRAVRDEDEALAEARLRALAYRPEGGAEDARGDAIAEALEPLLPLVEARNAALRRALGALAYESPFEAAVHLAGMEGEEAIHLAESILRATDGLWEEAFFGAAQRTLGRDATELGWSDLPRVLRSAGLDVPLRRRRPRETLDATLARLELDLSAVDRLQIDADPREDREARSLCLPMPGGARLALPEDGGPRHGDLFRDVGCALVAARGGNVPPEPVLRAFGGLFARLTAQVAWLTEVGGMTGAEARARGAALGLRRLFLVRHHAALLLAEAERGKGQAAYERAYARHMARAFGIRVPGAVARLERTTPLEAVDLLRGELLASMLAEAMGEAWWNDPASRQRLDLLLDAGVEGIDALITALGREALEVGPFVTELRAALAPPEV